MLWCFTEALQADFDSRELNLTDEFNSRLRESQARFQDEIKQSKAELAAKYKKDYGMIKAFLSIEMKHLIS